MSSKGRFATAEEEFEYLTTPEPTLFDWEHDVPALCIAPVPNHPAYDMGLSQYRKHRTYESDEKTKEKRALCFRVNPILAFMIPVVSRKFDMHAHPFLTSIIEMGLIRFQRDYHDTYSVINVKSDTLYDMGSGDYALGRTMQLKKQVIDIGIHLPTKAPVFSPTVPDWVYAATKSTSKELNMGYQQFVLVCVCKGLLATESEKPIPEAYRNKIQEVIYTFENELFELKDRADDLTKRLESSISK